MGLEIALSAAAAAALLVVIRLGAPGWVLVALACTPVIAIYAVPDLRLISWHGFLHSGITYRILAEGVPPFDPLFAERALLYPWAHHAVAAELTRWTGISPASGFALMNLGALALTVTAVFGIARTLFEDRTTAALAGALTVYGLAAAPVAIALSLTSVELESRLIPIQKFTNPNSNALGILCYALGLLALVRMIDEPDAAQPGWMWLLFGAVLGAAWLYPLVWAPFVVVAIGATMIAHVQLETPSRAKAVRICAAILIASAIASPYLAGIALQKSSPATIAPDLSIQHLVRNGANLVLVALSWLALLWFARADLRAVWKKRPGAIVLGVVAAAIPAAMFGALHAAVHSEYKFLALCGFVLAIPGARTVALLYRRNAMACFALLWLLLWPAANYFVQMFSFDFRGTHAEVRERGWLLTSADADEAALYQWIREETDPDAVFVDRTLSIPSFGHRQLFVPFDPPRGTPVRTGFGLPPTEFLRDVMGYPMEEVESRRKIAEDLLSPLRSAAGRAALVDLRDRLRSPNVYLVAREANVSYRFDTWKLPRVFSSEAIAVYRVETKPAADAPEGDGDGPS